MGAGSQQQSADNEVAQFQAHEYYCQDHITRKKKVSKYGRSPNIDLTQRLREIYIFRFLLTCIYCKILARRSASNQVTKMYYIAGYHTSDLLEFQCTG